MRDYLLIFVLLFFSAFFSGTEIAYTAVNKTRLAEAAEAGSSAARLAVRISNKFDKALSAVLIGNNFVNIAASAVSTTIALSIAGGRSEGPAVVLATAIITVLILIFGEIVPKIVCKNNAKRMACITAYPLAFFIILFSPITFIVSLILRLCGRFWGEAEETYTASDIDVMVDEAEKGGGIKESTRDYLHGALDFADTTLAEVITHRTNVLALDIDESREEDLRIIHSSRFSRLPVYKDSIDNIIGILNINHFYKAVAEDPDLSIRQLMLEPTFMHGTTKLPDALADMRENQVQMVVVLDEYGGTYGIATMEDILEQIVGEIWDENDVIVEEFTKNEDGSFKVLGDMNVYDFFDELDIDDRDFDSDCNTVGGWCVELLGQNPEVGMTLDYKTLHIEITKVDDIVVEEVRVTLTEPDGDGEKEN
ncbi:MAG: HlyC/CorC family transporter [Clostridia bacterium]|nr:HlyC/CorC family transporter [Clostridia bacterium]